MFAKPIFPPKPWPFVFTRPYFCPLLPFSKKQYAAALSSGTVPPGLFSLSQYRPTSGLAAAAAAAAAQAAAASVSGPPGFTAGMAHDKNSSIVDLRLKAEKHKENQKKIVNNVSS